MGMNGEISAIVSAREIAGGGRKLCEGAICWVEEEEEGVEG